MKLLLLHGPAITSSRKKLLEIKNNFGKNDVVVFEKGSDPKVILASLQTVSMFDENRLVIAENPSEDLISDLSLITYHLSLILWFDHELKKLPEKRDDLEILFFPEAKEASVFPLLDLLGNRDKRAFLELKKRNQTSPNDTQYILTMIFYLLRSLAITPKNTPEFVKKKLAKQRENFPLEKVKDLYKFVIETDFKIKKGLMETEQAEFILVNRFLL